MIDDEAMEDYREAMEDYRTRFDTEITPVLEQLSKVRKAYLRRVTQDARLDSPDRMLLCTHTDAVILYSLLALDGSSQESAAKYMNAVSQTVLELIEEKD